MISNDSDYDMEFEDFVDLMKQTATNIKRMNAVQNYARYQMGENDAFDDLRSSMREAMDGWVSSNC